MPKEITCEVLKAERSIDAAQSCIVADARLRAFRIEEAFKVYRMVMLNGETLFASIKEGEGESEAYEFLLNCASVIELVYRATPPQWN